MLSPSLPSLAFFVHPLPPGRFCRQCHISQQFFFVKTRTSPRHLPSIHLFNCKSKVGWLSRLFHLISSATSPRECPIVQTTQFPQSRSYSVWCAADLVPTLYRSPTRFHQATSSTYRRELYINVHVRLSRPSYEARCPTCRTPFPTGSVHLSILALIVPPWHRS